MKYLDNWILKTDGYKASHSSLYPPNMVYMQSYLESRQGAKWEYSVLFGLQYYLMHYLCNFKPTPQLVDQAAEFYAQYFGSENVFNHKIWMELAADYKELPLTIWSYPEGTLLRKGTPLVVVESTDPKYAWLVNYITETLLVKLWYPITVATQSYYLRHFLENLLTECGRSKDLVPYMVHDFGYRGSTSEESAALGGAAHLLSFRGSDTLAGDCLLRDYYEANCPSSSIPASEHSTVTSWGEGGELEFLKNLLARYPKGLVANVIDSYDPYRYINTYVRSLRQEIMSRDGKVIFRPDSGNPQEMVISVLDWLEDIFGSTVQQGLKELPPCVGVICGDGMTYESIQDLYRAVVKAGWSPSNLAVGSGGGLLQKMDRDTQCMAFKACLAYFATFNSIYPREIFKKPSTDASKASKRGNMLNATMTKVWSNGLLLSKNSLGAIHARMFP